MGKVVSATGHRPNAFSFKYNENDSQCILLKKMLKQQLIQLINHGYTLFIQGMAIGFDFWFAEAVIELKEIYDIQLEAAIPCANQEKTWPKEAQKRYHKIKEKCDIITFISNKEYSPYLMLKRDEYMVDKSNMLLACYNGSKGGTRHTFLYAIDKNINIIHINPNKMSVNYINNK